MRYAMIMAGGQGTRLWPMSRVARPKQLLRFIGAGGGGGPVSLLGLAADRLEGVVPAEGRYVCTAERYRGAVREALPGMTDERILGEPAARDTVNAVGFAAAVFEKLDRDAVFMVVTADHLISPQDVFAECADLGFRLVEEDATRLVTFAIKPTFAATQYGYVERGRRLTTEVGRDARVFSVERFVEKPPRERAQAYFESGEFNWNSGMFVFHAGTLLECLKRYKPECHEGLRRIQGAWGTADQARVLGEVYPGLPKTSVDYAVMEPASRDRAVSICSVLMDVSWLDVGSWPSYAETVEPDGAGNRVGGVVKAVMKDSSNNLVVGDDAGHTVALLGCEDLVVVHTKDATLVMPRGRADGLKGLHDMLGEELK